MKRPKRAIVTEKTYTGSIYSVQCPHCKTIHTGGFSKYTDRMFCPRCEEVIMLEWDEVNASSRT